MQEKNYGSSDSIKNILDEMREKDKAKSNAEEYVIGEESSVRGLVFDYSDEDDTVPRQVVPKVSFEQTREPDEKPVEFFVPEKFEVNVKYDTPTEVEDAPRIVTTYVPRFTEASENYRMSDDPRPRVTKLEQKNREDGSATAEIYEDIDPTAEIGEKQNPPTVAVKVVKPDNEKELESATKVFKFVENELPREEAVHISAESVDEETEELNELAEESEEPIHTADERREYKIPDPVDEPAVVEYRVSSALSSRKTLEDAPVGVGDRLDEEKTGRVREYTSYANRDSFKDRFLDTIMSVRVRFFAAALVALILLWTECMFVFGVDIPLIMNLADISGAMALLDMQFVTCLLLLSVPEVIRAVKYAFRKKLTPELFIIFSYAVIIAYTVVISVHSPRIYPLFGFLFSVSVLAAIGAAYFRISAEFTAFKRISRNGEKLMIDRKLTRTLEYENSALDGIVEEHKSKTCRTFRSVFVSDFFKRAGECSENSFNILVILAASFGLSVVTAAISFFILGGWVNAVSAFAIVFMLGCPAMSIMLHKLPLLHAAEEADSEHSAVIGENSLYDYAGVDVITFEDTEVFGSEDVTLQRIMLYGRSDNLTKALRQMSALFMNVGGPLDVLFSDALDRKCSAARSVYVEELGLGGEIDGRPVFAGTMEYMLSKGMRIPEDEVNLREVLSDSTKVMYAAEDGEVYAKFYIRYSFSEEFSMLLPVLEDYGIIPLVYTRDPNITNELAITLTAGADKIRIIKKNDTDSSDSAVYRRVSCGLVSTGDKSNVINMILLSKKYAALGSRFAITELISMLVGASLATVLAIGGMATVASVALAGWQLVWCGALHFISRRSFRKAKRNKQ